MVWRWEGPREGLKVVWTWSMWLSVVAGVFEGSREIYPGVGLQARGFYASGEGWLTVVYLMYAGGGGIPALFLVVRCGSFSALTAANNAGAGRAGRGYLFRLS